MKRICFVDFDMSVTGGVEQVTASLVNALCKTYKVYLWAATNMDGELAYEIDPRVVYTQMEGKEERLRNLIARSFKPFRKFIKENQIDIVVMMGNYPALIVGGTRPFTKAKYIYCDHGALMNQWHQKDITLIRFFDARMSHKVVTLTEKTRDDYRRQFHLPKKKVTCIANWIDTERLKKEKPYDIKSKKILTVGRFGKEKGYDLLVKVAERVLPKNPKWEWHLYGTGETFEEIKSLIKEKGLENQLILKGNVKDAHRIFQEYAFLVLTSYREGLPIVLLEAAALGLPMVSFDIETGPSEIIEDEKSGCLIPPYDTARMAAAIGNLMQDEEKRKRYSQGTKDIVEKFAKERILQRWIQLFEHM